MFYSHRVLARKAPLGQIWMAATMHVKMNRRKLDKINIINICEEILNPSVPMALRLSGILMGGVVIVYERKVKLVYEDVTRLLVELNQAWKVKPVSDPTILPKGKSQAKYEFVTLPDNHEAELGGIEQSLHYSNSNTVMGFQQTSYINMQLDHVDVSSHNPGEEDQPQDNNQADVANITLTEQYQGDTGFFNGFGSFEIEGDEKTEMNYAAHDYTDIPRNLTPSPPRQDGAQKPDEIQEQHPGYHANQQSDEDKDTLQDAKRRGQPRVRERKRPVFYMDKKQTIIPGQIYQSWLQITSDIVPRKGRKRKHLGTMCSVKIARLMDLPPVGLTCGLFANGIQDINYPAPLLKLWMRSTQPPQDCPSGRTSPHTPPQPPKPSSSSPPVRVDFHDPIGYAVEDEVHMVEKQRAKVNSSDIPGTIFMEELRTNFKNIEIGVTEANVTVTSGNSGDEVRSIHSSGSGNGIPPHHHDDSSVWFNKKRPFPSSRHSGSSLETVDEDFPWQNRDINIAGIHETENDDLMETRPTQTQQNAIIKNQPLEQITESIRTQLKMHFDTPGSAQTESLNHLALGMNRKKAACLFYQTCVLASRDFVKVQQRVPYGDIIISRGEKM